MELSIEKLTPTIGAEVTGIDLGEPLSDEGLSSIRKLLLEQATAAGLPSHQRPQKVLVISESLSEESGTLTRGLKKVVPKAIAAKYMDQIEAAYAG